MTPIDALLNTVEWRPTPQIPPPDGLPYATHEGVLTIEGYALRCYELSDGRRVFDADDIQAMLDLPKK